MPRVLPLATAFGPRSSGWGLGLTYGVGLPRFGHLDGLLSILLLFCFGPNVVLLFSLFFFSPLAFF